MSAIAVPNPAPDLVPLNVALANAGKDQSQAPGFEAWLSGSLVSGESCDGVTDTSGQACGPLRVRAVLERTAVVELGPEERRLARHDALLVDPSRIEWRDRASPRPRRRPLARPDLRPERAAAAPGAGPAAADEVPAGPVPPPAGPIESTPAPAQEPSATPTEVASAAASTSPSEAQPTSRRRRAGPDAGARGRRERAGLRPAPTDLNVLVARAIGAQDLLDHVIVLARHAHELEEEIERSRHLERRLRQLVGRIAAATRSEEESTDD